MSANLTQFLAVSSSHGWGRDIDARTAIKKAVKESYDEKKNIKIFLYKVHTETNVNDDGAIEFPSTDPPVKIGMFNSKYQILSGVAT